MNYDCLWAHVDQSVIDTLERTLKKYGVHPVRCVCDGLPAIEANCPQDVMKKASVWFSSTEPARW